MLAACLNIGMCLWTQAGCQITFVEERFAELIGGLSHTILMAELSDDVHRASTGETARALRARFHRKLASRSPRRRIIRPIDRAAEDTFHH